MKTIIAKRDKNIFWFFLFMVLFSCLVSGYTIVKSLTTDFRWFGIFAIVCLSFMTLISLVSLIALPNAAIIKEDENIIIYHCVFKKTIGFASVISAEVAPIQPKEKESKNGSILLKIKTENGQEDILIHQIKDKKNAVEQFNKLINGSI